MVVKDGGGRFNQIDAKFQHLFSDCYLTTYQGCEYSHVGVSPDQRQIKNTQLHNLIIL